MADKYAVEWKPKFSTSGLDSQFLLPTSHTVPLPWWSVFLSILQTLHCPLLQTHPDWRVLLDTFTLTQVLSFHYSLSPSYCCTKTICSSKIVHMTLWTPWTQKLCLFTSLSQCSAQCLGTSSIQCIILILWFLKAKHFSLWNPKSIFSHYHFQVVVNNTGKITFENKS